LVETAAAVVVACLQLVMAAAVGLLRVAAVAGLSPAVAVALAGEDMAAADTCCCYDDQG
jgi:hypothetical protein